MLFANLSVIRELKGALTQSCDADRLKRYFVSHLFPDTSLGWGSVPSEKASCQSALPDLLRQMLSTIPSSAAL